MYVNGCYFEQNTIAIDVGTSPLGVSSIGVFNMAGCWFKDNGTAIKMVNGAAAISVVGTRIEASESVTVGGSRPQYGIYIGPDKAGNSLFSGILVTGQFEHSGIFVEPHAGAPVQSHLLFLGVRSFNTSTHSGVAWPLPNTSCSGQFIECNSGLPVYTVANITPEFEGDTLNVSDSSSATWAATAAGSGSTHALVRWDGTNWKVAGI